MPDTKAREPFFGLFLVVAGLIGVIASLALSIEKVVQLQNPTMALSCDVSVLVQCSTNLQSEQGAVFGFPNPFMGLIGFGMVLTVGVSVWATPRFARWFWGVFNLGVLGALALVIWLIAQSIYVLGTLCPWCLVVWVITIPLAVFLTGRNARTGVFGARVQPLGGAAWPWLTLVSFVLLLVVAVLAQLELDVIGSLTF